MTEKDRYVLYSLLIFLSCFLLGSLHTCGQTYNDTIGYDQMESYTWSGNWWLNNSNIGFASNIAVSSPASAYFYGTGGGNSPAEYNWYVLPSIDTLNPDEEHKMKFHFSSPRITSTGSTSGIDLADYIDIQVSTDGGVTYNSEVRITGFNNAYWDYNSTTITKVVNGTLDTYTPAGGGDRTLLGDGYSVVELTFPLGVTQIAVDVYVRANAAGEEFWMDDFFMLGSGGGGFALPIDLVSFTASLNEQNDVSLQWIVASEVNNDYFSISRSYDFYNWELVGTVDGRGNSNVEKIYTMIDTKPTSEITYYRLTQTDYDGNYESFPPISLMYKERGSEIISTVNVQGQQVDGNYRGIVIDIYKDNTIKKRMQNE